MNQKHHCWLIVWGKMGSIALNLYHCILLWYLPVFLKTYVHHFLQELNHSHSIFSTRYLLIDIHTYYVSVCESSKWKPELSPSREVCTNTGPWGIKIDQMNLANLLSELLKTRSHMECVNNRSAPSYFELLPFYHHCIITLRVWGFFYSIIKVNEIL